MTGDRKPKRTIAPYFLNDRKWEQNDLNASGSRIADPLWYLCFLPNSWWHYNLWCVRSSATFDKCFWLYRSSNLQGANAERANKVCLSDGRVLTLQGPLSFTVHRQLSTGIQWSSATQSLSLGVTPRPTRPEAAASKSPEKCEWRFTKGLNGDDNRTTELGLWMWISCGQHTWMTRFSSVGAKNEYCSIPMCLYVKCG